MKLPLLSTMLLLPLSIAFTPVVHAAAASDASPYDLAPACMERTDASTSNCVVQDEGAPRHRYAPPGQPGARPGATPGTGATSTTTGTTGSSSTATTTGPRDGGRSRVPSSGK